MDSTLAIVGRSLETPMSKDLSDISGRLAIAGNAACALDRPWTGIVGSHCEVNHAEPVEHLPQIPRRAEDVGHGVKSVEDTEFLCRCGHQLSKARGTRRTDGQRVVARFRPYECIEQARGQ